MSGNQNGNTLLVQSAMEELGPMTWGQLLDATGLSVMQLKSAMDHLKHVGVLQKSGQRRSYIYSLKDRPARSKRARRVLASTPNSVFDLARVCGASG